MPLKYAKLISVFPLRTLATFVILSLAALGQGQQAPAPCLQKPAAERPYSKDRLLAMVKDQTPGRAEFLIRACGVAVVWSDGLASELKAADASDKVIQAVHEMAGKPALPPGPKIPIAPPPAAGPKPGELKTNPKDTLTYAFVPPGSFDMGCRDSEAAAGCEHDELPLHKVRITKGFWLGQTEVTVGAYKRYVQAAGIKMPPEPAMGSRSFNPGWATDDLPMSMVTWEDSRNYCHWLGMRLPTEGEWEYAARGPGGGAPEISRSAWYADNSGQQPLDSEALRKNSPKTWIGKLIDNQNGPHQVAQKTANGWKLHDMLGNVWEWTSDFYREDAYMAMQGEDPIGPDAGFHHVLRGGSWLNLPSYVRASKRLKGIPDQRIYTNGFRCAGPSLTALK
jgi:sulfatase modifying factor 1